MAETRSSDSSGETFEGKPRLADEVALKTAINVLRDESRSGTERLLAQATIDLLGDKDRFRSLHNAVTGAVDFTKPPEGVELPIVDYGGEGEVQAEPWGTLAALIGEAAGKYNPDQPGSGVELEEAVELYHQMTGSIYRGMPMSKELLQKLLDQAETDTKNDEQEQPPEETTN